MSISPKSAPGSKVREEETVPFKNELLKKLFTVRMNGAVKKNVFGKRVKNQECLFIFTIFDLIKLKLKKHVRETPKI